MGIADDDIAKVRAATDIVAVISEHLQLRRVGQRWTGLCPFHNEKSPSFSVNQQLGFYHCFGCQRSGDAITFVREIEGLDFVGAVERLASKAGVTLTYTSADEGKHRRRRASAGRGRGRSRGLVPPAAARSPRCRCGTLVPTVAWHHRRRGPHLPGGVGARRLGPAGPRAEAAQDPRQGAGRGGSGVHQQGQPAPGHLPGPDPVPDLRRQQRPRRVRRPQAARHRRPQVQELLRVTHLRQVPAPLRPQLGQGACRARRRGDRL